MASPEFVLGLLYWSAVAVVLLVVADLAHREYRSWRREQLDLEWAHAHTRIRRRMRALTRRGGDLGYTEPRAFGAGWVWIATNKGEETMGLAWTRRGARRRVNALRDHDVLPVYIIRSPRED